MKKWVIALSLLMLLPCQALALQELNEDDMGAISGQAGVSIAVDDVIIYQHIESRSYTDADGTDGTAGTVSISDFTGMLHVNAITSLDGDGKPFSPGRDVLGHYADGFSFANTGPVFISKALTIDVGTLAVLSAGLANNDVMGQILGQPALTSTTVAGVRIGLPTVEIYRTAQSFDITVTSEGAYNSGASYGTIGVGNSTMAVLDGFVEIAPH